MGISSIRGDEYPNRDTVGLGSWLTPKDHTRGPGRPVEKRIEQREEEARTDTPETRKRGIKSALTRSFHEAYEEHSSEDLREVALKIRNKAGEYLSAEDIKNSLAAVAIYIALQNSDIQVELPEEPHPSADLFVKSGELQQGLRVRYIEGSDVNIQRLNSAGSLFQANVGDDNFSIITGKPHPQLEGKLAKEFKEKQI